MVKLRIKSTFLTFQTFQQNKRSFPRRVGEGTDKGQQPLTRVTHEPQETSRPVVRPESIMCWVRLSDNGPVPGSSLPQSLSRSVNHREGEKCIYLDLIIKWIRENRPAQSRGMCTNKHAGRQCQHSQTQNWNEVTTNQLSIFALCFDL